MITSDNCIDATYTQIPSQPYEGIATQTKDAKFGSREETAKKNEESKTKCNVKEDLEYRERNNKNLVGALPAMSEVVTVIDNRNETANTLIPSQSDRGNAPRMGRPSCSYNQEKDDKVTIWQQYGNNMAKIAFIRRSGMSLKIASNIDTILLTGIISAGHLI